MPLRRDISKSQPEGASAPQHADHINGITNGEVNGKVNGEVNGDTPILDMVIVGAGFAGVWLLHQLRQRGFNAKIVEAGDDLGGVWYWNRYPGARVDSQYPVYALNLPEVFKDWTWSSHYPDHAELRAYFQHIDKCLHVKKDCVFGTKVVAADWDDAHSRWTLRCDTGRTLQTRFWTACTGFSAKRYFPDWQGLESFQGVIHHSSFWPEQPVDVKGKHVAVIGTGATGVQLTQELSKEIGDEGSLKMFQRTPNLACPMNQIFLTKEQHDAARDAQGELFDKRMSFHNGFLYQWRDNLTFDHSAEERNEFYWMLWRMGGFRFLMNSYIDMTREERANQEAYNFWRDRVRERVQDPRKRELLAPQQKPHLFGGKRLSLEQDFYDQFNKPNVDVIDVRDNPIEKFVADGIVQQDGTYHKLDMIALATGFDSITGGIKDIAITGIDGERLNDKWAQGTWTYLGMTTAHFPNFFFTYGPQAPTAFSNGPSCVEVQGTWIADVLSDMRDRGWTRLDAKQEPEQEWKDQVNNMIKHQLRGKVDSWYNGANIPGKPREVLNYAGGIPLYKKTIEAVRANGMDGFEVS